MGCIYSFNINHVFNDYLRPRQLTLWIELILAVLAFSLLVYELIYGAWGLAIWLLLYALGYGYITVLGSLRNQPLEKDARISLFTPGFIKCY